MAKREAMEVAIAVAEAASVCEVDAIAAYPITPQTHVVEHLSEIVADGELDAEFIPVESEHSAMSACCGTSAVGARTFTATSSQGLALMHEILFIASGMRLPIVMVVANRALSAPLNIWNDHSDIMSERDCGWIQTFAENGQEAFDLVLHAFKVAEDPEVMVPVMVNFDGFIMSHVVEPIEILTREEARKYLPPFKPMIQLNPRAPITLGPVGIPEIYTEARMSLEHAVRQSINVVRKGFEDFDKCFGRKYKLVEEYETKGADILLLTMGGISETAMTAIDQMRARGEKVGLVRIRLFRPFPFDDFAKAVAGAKVIAVVDRALSIGGPGGPVASEVKSALYQSKDRPKIIEFIAGLGGRDVKVENFIQMHEKAKAVLAGGPIPPFELIGLRG
jgi:pyruvate ferredoxin oxidoreductase alpha subunit